MILFYEDISAPTSSGNADDSPDLATFYRQVVELSGRKVVPLSGYDERDSEQFVIGLNRQGTQAGKGPEAILDRFALPYEKVSRGEVLCERVTKRHSFRRGTVATIITSYNYGAFLPEAIESVLRQSYRPDLILVIDDCSNDRSYDIAKSYSRKYPDLVRAVRNEKNLGIVRCFNKAVSLTSTDYVCFLGADNRFRSDYLERTLPLLEADSSCAVAYTDYALFGIRARSEYAAFPPERRGDVKLDTFFVINFPDFNESTARELETRSFIHGSSLFRRKAFDQVGGYVERNELPEDHGLFVRMVKAGWTAKRAAAPLLEYRQHSIEQANTKLSSYRELLYFRQEAERLRDELAKARNATERQEGADSASAKGSAFETNDRAVDVDALETKLTQFASANAALVGQLRDAGAAAQRMQEPLSRLEQPSLSSGPQSNPEAVVGSCDATVDRVRRGKGVRIRRALKQISTSKIGYFINPASRRVRYFPIFSVTSLLSAPVQDAGVSMVAWNGGNMPRLPVPILKGTKYEWSFLWPHDASLDAVNVLVGTSGRVNNCTLLCEIFIGGHLTASHSTCASGLRDNSFLRFSFGKRGVIGPQQVAVRLSSPDASSDHHIAVWSSDTSQQLIRHDISETLKRGYDTDSPLLFAPPQGMLFVPRQVIKNREDRLPQFNSEAEDIRDCVHLFGGLPLTLSLSRYIGTLEQVGIAFECAVDPGDATLLCELLDEQGQVIHKFERHCQDVFQRQDKTLFINIPASVGVRSSVLRLTASESLAPQVLAIKGRTIKDARCPLFLKSSQDNQYVAPPTEVRIPLYQVSFKDTLLGQYRSGLQRGASKVDVVPVGVEPLLFSFVGRGDNLVSLTLFSATYDRTNTCDIRVRIYGSFNGGERLVAEYSVSGRAVPDNTEWVIPLGLIPESRGRFFRVEIDSPNSSVDNQIGLYVSSIRTNSLLFASFEKESAEGLDLTNYGHALLDIEAWGGGNSSLENSAVSFNTDAVTALLWIDTTSPETTDDRFSELAEALGRKGVRIDRIAVEAIDSLSTYSRQFDGVFLRGDFITSRPAVDQSLFKVRQLCLTLSKLCIPVIAGDENHEQSSEELLRYVDFVVRPSSQGVVSIEFERENLIAESIDQLPSLIATRYRKRVRPLCSIVSVLYGKEREVPFFLQALSRQTYKGEFEIILVDDCSPDESSKVATSHWKELMERVPKSNRPPLKVVKNAENRGNCGSRLVGIEQAKGDVVVIIDADCIVNKHFLEAHVEAHARGDCDVVIGPLNIETGQGDPMVALQQFEATPSRALREADLQDPLNPPGFLNCVTRNFSIRADFVTEDLFDELFAYSKKPDSGFGWEDIEMGYRLYKRGARIVFADRSFSLHVSHPPSVEEGTKPLRSLLNFKRLVVKHPEMRYVARRWVLETYRKICAWADGLGLPYNEDRRHLDYILRDENKAPLVRTRERPLRILTYRWHVPHQVELYKMPHKFSLVQLPVQTFSNHWNFDERAMPSNADFIPIDQVRESDFDLILLHFDENCISPENCNGVLDSHWGAAFRHLRSSKRLPMVAICHGTPQFYGQYCPTYDKSDLGMVSESERQRLVDYMGDILVVCNSYQAQREWRFNRSKVIWQGFDPTQFPPSSYERGILTLGPSMKNRPYYRGWRVYQDILARLPKEMHPTHTRVSTPSIRYKGETQEYAWAKFRKYVQTLGQFSVYLNPTIRSPMPRCRGEAMMCGLVPVSLNNHDVELFIRNGVNGFYADNAPELADYLHYLMRNPSSTRRIGEAARQTASDLFNHDRYLREWEKTINEIVG